MKTQKSLPRPRSFLQANFTAENIQRIDRAIAKTGQPLDVIIVELGLMQEEKLGVALAEFADFTFIGSLEPIVDHSLVKKLGAGFLSQQGMIPISPSGSNQTSICVADPFDDEAKAIVGYALGEQPKIYVSTRAAIQNALAASGSRPSDEVSQPDNDNFELSAADLDRLKTVAEEAPVVRLISRLVQAAVDSGATDIHIEPMAQDVQIRLRVDGVLVHFEKAGLNMLPGISTRIKILAKLNISERRLPQDGRMCMGVRGVDVDFRVSVVPSVHGETIVLRVLDRSRVQLDLQRLGFDADATEKLRGLANLKNGIVLVTGPTGSGKTTSLYAMLNMIDVSRLKVFTVEDPVEYPMEGVTQLQVNPEIGLTFASALRSVLRQDPDVILVGEIRDQETAELAMQAALTGHLVLSTLHTNSAVGAVTRLRDMGLDDYLIGATLKGSVGQRLLRKSCTACRNQDSAECEICGGSGLKGRTATYEIFAISTDLAKLVGEGKSETQICDAALCRGLMPLHEHAASLVKGGITTQEELLRVLHLLE